MRTYVFRGAFDDLCLFKLSCAHGQHHAAARAAGQVFDVEVLFQEKTGCF